ncbi:odorant receptor Or1 [Solenopsis invicta]|uniref:odorant receptor Or1 n=1 Tax=Solenopsis invicta TaxID=13686 RepID=UPI00193E0906|nr:odorant receptor Or1 [Solenopsis invicta]
MGIVTVLCVALSSLIINFRNRKLTFKAWLPFDYSSEILFYITFTHQLISIVAAVFVNVGCDTLICGLLVHICCQIEILTYRLRKIMSYSNILRDCIYQHYHIFRFAVIVNAKFKLTITIQFVMSTVILCFSLYHLSRTTSKAKYLETTLYICCFLTQLFIYCWYGNEVKVKSYEIIDKIFEIEWLTLDEDSKKALIMIIRRALVPIQIMCTYTIPMNLNSFMNVSINITETNFVNKFHFHIYLNFFIFKQRYIHGI